MGGIAELFAFVILPIILDIAQRGHDAKLDKLASTLDRIKQTKDVTTTEAQDLRTKLVELSQSNPALVPAVEKLNAAMTTHTGIQHKIEELGSENNPQYQGAIQQAADANEKQMRDIMQQVSNAPSTPTSYHVEVKDDNIVQKAEDRAQSDQRKYDTGRRYI